MADMLSEYLKKLHTEEKTSNRGFEFKDVLELPPGVTPPPDGAQMFEFNEKPMLPPPPPSLDGNVIDMNKVGNVQEIADVIDSYKKTMQSREKPTMFNFTPPLPETGTGGYGLPAEMLLELGKMEQATENSRNAKYLNAANYLRELQSKDPSGEYQTLINLFNARSAEKRNALEEQRYKQDERNDAWERQVDYTERRNKAIEEGVKAPLKLRQAEIEYELNKEDLQAKKDTNEANKAASLNITSLFDPNTDTPLKTLPKDYAQTAKDLVKLTRDNVVESLKYSKTLEGNRYVGGIINDKKILPTEYDAQMYHHLADPNSKYIYTFIRSADKTASAVQKFQLPKDRDLRVFRVGARKFAGLPEGATLTADAISAFALHLIKKDPNHLKPIGETHEYNY